MSAVPRIIHFVTGGGSGATKVALDLACGHLASGRFEPLLVLRRKSVPLPGPMQNQIAAAGLRTAWVDRWPKFRTASQLAALCSESRPHVFVAHGNSEHLWGRMAAFRAGVRAIVHVEHNLERYPFWRVWRARGLAARTTATVCVSHGVADRVRSLGMAAQRLEVIHNGIQTERFAAGAPPLEARRPDIVMAARFARQKDHATLLRAARLLADRGWNGRLLLAGGGKASHRKSAESLARRLSLGNRVDFLGSVADMPALLHGCRVFVLSSHHEGMPLALVEAMAAGCAVAASNIPGVTDVFRHGDCGWLFPQGDAEALAALLMPLLTSSGATADIVRRGQARATAEFDVSRMVARYEGFFAELCQSKAGAEA